MQLFLTGVCIGAANGNILVRATEATHRVSLEVRKRQETVILQQTLAHTDFLDVLGAFDRNHRGAVGIHDVHGRKRPVVDLERVKMLGRRIAIPRIISVGLDDRGVLDVVCKKLFNPLARQDVGASLFACVQLHSHLAGENGRDLGNDLAQAVS